jgi:hypothetical protein
MAMRENHVAEMQGLYGPFTLTERVVQKIWLRGDFDRTRLTLVDGRPLEIRTFGAWNLLGGPDFRGARLAIDGENITGDIEVHFHVADWRAHRHETDRAYDQVVLHVVLFPPAPGEKPAVRGDGREIPTLVLLPWLHRDLEEYASDDALEVITARDEWEKFAGLAATPPAELPGLLRAKAIERWRQKVRFAQLRIERVGWPAAAHCTALEILGYRHNRAAMLTVATKYPLEAWVDGVNLARVFDESGALWQTQGVRPANHPRARLQQYQGWIAAQPDWPARLLGLARMLPGVAWNGGDLAAGDARNAAGAPRLPEFGGPAPTKLARQALGLAKLRETFARDITGDVLGGTRLDNLVCDGFLPLVAAQAGIDPGIVWFHWFLGDVPDQVRSALPKLGVAGRGARPFCQGWGQGLLGWILEQEARASR